ncbi:MAG: M3 family oligoendopeptidase [Candidatus Omnitrophica bacterium]|nr:M3 family oligoendopeptidase [Candidatus Omnitrophota bacterium]
MSKLNFDQLPVYEPRHFVPPEVDLTNSQTVVDLYQGLIHRDVKSAKELEQWILDRSEMEASVDQAGDAIYIRMTCQTDNQEFANEYKKFIETVVPAIQPLNDQLNKKYLELRKQFPVTDHRYEVYDREIRSEIELFREENVPLMTQVQLLSQEYQTICGAMTVEFQGKNRTLPEMGKFLQEPDRVLRESAWRATAERRIQERDRLDEIFDKMLQLRHKIAQQAGCRNYMEYQFRAYQRFDYTPQDCKQYHQAIEKHVTPVWKKILERRRAQMKLEKLKPWDMQVDPLGRAPLKPFEKVEQLISGVEEIFKKIHPSFGTEFREMSDLGLLDLESRPGKAPGGYQNTLDEARKPFIFMNAVGVDDDVRTLLHEGGHAFHALACAGQPIHHYRHAPMEFCEVASMSMELLGDPHLNVFYSEEDFKRSTENHLESIIYILGWVATIDAFQHWIYEHPSHSREEREKIWFEIYDRFGGKFLDWDGLQEFKKSLWHRQLHIFEVPFYYIEYGIAQLGALQVWLKSRQDLHQAVENYRRGLAMGRSRPLPELFTAAGINFDFSEKTIAPLVKEVEKELAL